VHGCGANIDTVEPVRDGPQVERVINSGEDAGTDIYLISGECEEVTVIDAGGAWRIVYENGTGITLTQDGESGAFWTCWT
jgi:hypothetical protein